MAPDARYGARSDSVLGLVSVAKAAVGLAALPIALGDPEDTLVRVLPPVAELARTWRLLAQPDARHLPPIAAFFDYVTAEAAALKPVLTG